MPAERYVPVLKKKYVEEIVPAFMKIFDLKNVMEVPRLVKISINRGFGCAKGDKKKIALFTNRSNCAIIKQS